MSTVRGEPQNMNDRGELRNAALPTLELLLNIEIGKYRALLAYAPLCFQAATTAPAPAFMPGRSGRCAGRHGTDANHPARKDLTTGGPKWRGSTNDHSRATALRFRPHSASVNKKRRTSAVTSEGRSWCSQWPAPSTITSR